MSRTFLSLLSGDVNEDFNVKKDDRKFTFSNGDSYIGGYMIVKDKQFLFRHGRGIYKTDDFNTYEAHWAEDQIVGEVTICHNNGTQYKGTLGTDGGMFAFGTYTFTDNSVLEATWEHNKPMADIILKNPGGLVWEGLCDGKEISFIAANHFWDEIKTSTNDGEGEDGEEHLDIKSNDFESWFDQL